MTKETYLKIKEQIKLDVKEGRYVSGLTYAAYWLVKHRVNIDSIKLAVLHNEPLDKLMQMAPSIKFHIPEDSWSITTISNIIGKYYDWEFRYEGRNDFPKVEVNEKVATNEAHKGLFSRIKEKLIG